MANRFSGSNNCCSSWSSTNQSFFSKPKFEINFEAGNSNYETILELLDDKHKPLGIKRKWVRLLIKNTGRADAHNCHVELTVPNISFNSGKLHPPDVQQLCWKNENTNYITLGRKVDKQYIEIIFADSNFDSDIHAIASTKELVKSVGFIPSQHGFGIGDIEIDVTVSGNGVTKTERMVLHVDIDYTKTSLQEFSNAGGSKRSWNTISNAYNRLIHRQKSAPKLNH